MNHLRVMALAAGALALLTGLGEAAMCVKKSGVVVVRDVCRKKETPITLDQSAGPQGPAGAGGVRGEKGDKGDPGGLRLVDSAGKFVGIVDVAHPLTVAVTVPNVGIGTLFTHGSDFLRTGVTLYHESADCKGEPLAALELDSLGGLIPLIPYVGTFADTAYFPVLPGSVRSLQSYEYWADVCSTSLTPRGLCCEALAIPEEGYQRLVAPTVPVPLSTLGTPPLRVVY